MADITATVLSVTGVVQARDADGNLRTLREGDSLRQGETIVTGPNGRVELLIEPGEIVALGADEQFTLGSEVAQSTRPEAAEVATDDATVQQVLQALEEGADLGEVLEAPAAGLAGGDGGEGFGFIRLERIGEELGPVSYAFPLEGSGDLDPPEEPFFPEADEESPPVELSATITIDVIAEDDVINAAESEQDITITGTVGGDAKPGDTVTLTVGGQSFTGPVLLDLTYAIDVPGSLLAQFDIVAANVSGADGAGNPYSADATRPYEVDTEASATITIDVIAGDDVINAEESEDDVTITGTVGGDAKEGDTVTLTIGGNEYTGLVAGDLTYSIVVPGSVLAAHSEVGANVSGSDAFGNAYSADATRPYDIDLDGPTVTVTFGDENLPAGGSTSITIDFSEEAYDPDTGEPLTAEQLEALLVVTGGTVSDLVQDESDPTVWTGTFTAGEDFAGQASAEVPDASYTDQAGNPGTSGSDALDVFDPPHIDGLDGTGAEVTVNEAYLPNGTQAGMGVAEGSGSFTITAMAGLAMLSFSGTGFTAQDFSLEQLNGIAGDGPLSFETSKGTLTLTGFTVNGDGTYTVDYTYTLTEAGDHPEQGVDEVAKDAIVVSAQDALGQESADSSLDVSIIDDIPVDVSQDAIVQNSADSVLVGNLVQFGADGPQSVEFTGVNGGADLYSNGVQLVYVIDGDTVTATAGEGGPVVFTIQASTDGTYTFEQFARIDLFQLLPSDTTASGQAGGPKDAYYIAEGSGGFSGDGSIPWLAKITGLNGAQINANNNQMGVSNPSITNGEGVRIDFDQTGLSGSANLVAAAEVGFNNFTAGSFTYVVTYVGGATASGTITPADLDGGLYLFPMSESGAAVDYIEFTASGTPSNTGISALNTYIMDDSMVADLEFEFNAVDGDGDTVPGSVSVTIQNDADLTGTGGDDALAGGGDDNEISGGEGNDALFGGDGDDILDGGDGEDLLFGGAGDDILQGGAGNDLLVGGQGDDILTGGDGDDTFQWLSGDVGSAGAPATDVVTDFGNGQNVLDLSDLLSDATNDTLGQYLSIESGGGDTVLKISSSGGFTGDALADAALVDQVIVLQGFSVGGDNLSEMLTSLGDQIKVDNSNN
jgi:hypothetical protein